MKKFCLIQYPPKDSMSKIIFSNYFNKHKLPYIYEDISIPKNLFEKNINKILLTYDGINITIPYKEKIIKFIKINDSAKKIGAVNCIYKNIGYNTDYLGFINSLNNLNMPKNITLIGAGGVSRAIIFGLYKIGVKKITLINRTIEKAFNLKKIFNYIDIDVMPLTSLNKIIKKTDFLINATSIGMQGETFNLKNNSIKIFYDTIYYETPLQKFFKNQNTTVINGKKMWFYQAIENLKLWNIYEKSFFDFFDTL
ncbi:shikimate dehydrogenase [Tepiditoga spiralis]|uniref:shikimate dehydrogenase (NADP(+)) n=1 Tax=Tepiditoga spiralis TaxID=2108365 RepID=A0A7G1G9F1_9BACT|nr:shikimate dehydrogenase [Tepiditoga spiralis]BBE31577.1 shikimate dehydrogenase [Tepiditoga spiralis]